MPITLELEPDRQLVIFRHVGDVPDEELLTFYRDFFADSRAAEYAKLLIHLEQTRSSGRSSQALRSLAGIAQERFVKDPVRLKVAVVAPADHSFGMARMYEALSGQIPWEFSVFRDADAARGWLGIDHASKTP